MAAAKRTRWECPTGSHPARLGPRQPRRDDIVRYCLSCSEATGRLVERIAPALERQRQAAAERTKTKAKRARAAAARRRAADVAAETERYTVDGVDLRDEVVRLCRLRTFGGAGGRLARRPPTFIVRRASARPRSVYGYAWPSRWRFQVTVFPGVDLAHLRETIVHELVHLYVGGEHSNHHAWHGPRWRTVMRQAFREAYGPDIVAPPNRYHGPYSAALRRRESAA